MHSTTSQMSTRDRIGAILRVTSGNFLEQFDREELYRDNEYNTLSGLLLDELKHIPSTGETLSWNGFRFEIVDMDGARIDKVLVHYAAPAPDGTLS